jgi:uncharacterized protein YdeI (YjbR/CyaY-like superfamily)
MPFNAMGTQDAAVPGDLRTALVAAGLLDRFMALSPSHRREYVSWIEEAKKAQTRAGRVERTIERLQAS